MKQSPYNFLLYFKTNSIIHYFSTKNNICINENISDIIYDILTYTPNNREYEPQEIKKIMEEIYANVGVDKSKLKIEILERKQ